MVLFLEAWKRRENMLAYNFDVLGETVKQEPVREDHQGKYFVNKITGKVRGESRINTFWRRIFMEVPVFLIAVSVTVAVTMLIQLVGDIIEKKKTNGEWNST